MSVKQPSLRGLVAWYVLPALVLGAIAAGAAAPPAAATREEVAGQEKGSKDEKKDEKKEEKKGLPLKPDRKIEFSTDEGTWLSLDVSPDGKTIVIGPREIWMYHIDGGTGIQVTKSKPTPAIRRQDRPNDLGVVASADGRYLYYAERQGDFSYNAMLPQWLIKRKDRRTGDEDVM